jgi:uncharacterized protein (UPF0335 family)
MARKLSEAMASANVDPSVIQACLAEYTQLDTESKRIAQKISSMFRRYEGQGVVPRSIKTAHRASKRDKAVAASEARTDLQYLLICGVLKPADEQWTASVMQSDMFAEPESVGTITPDLARARAYSDGYNSGRHGAGTENNQHQPGTQEYVAWDEGHRDGIADRNMNPRNARGKQADATAKRPVGRPKGSRNKRPAVVDAEAAEEAEAA